MQRKLVYFCILASIGLLSLAGCGSSGSGGDQTSGTPANVDSNGVAYVTAAKCLECHDSISWSATNVANYLEGKHVTHSDHINAASDPSCLQCHDKNGDGAGLEAFLPAADVPDEGLAAVGCESCHGAGGEHFGVGPIPIAVPDFNVCGQCHNASMFHNAYHPEGDNILEDYIASPHADSGDRPQAVCSRCHTDEGGRLYRDVNSVSRLQSVVLPIENASPIQCRTCHNPHDPNKLLLDEVSSHGVVSASAEFATCTSCHQRPDAQFEFDGAGNPVVTQLDGSTSSDGASGDMIYHATRYTRVIASSHYDNPDTSYQNNSSAQETNIIEGYVVDPTSERACRDCHNVHAADTTINRQWARSGHGGGILAAKEAANADSHSVTGALDYRAAGANGADNAFPHYDWDAGNRQSCQMCHTATGYKNYANNPATYDPANNDFSYLSGWSVDAAGVVTSSGQNELLYCWACHKDNAGDMRFSGPVTAMYTYDGAPVVFPDVGSSNTCVVCHSGRGNNETASTSSRFAGHHAPAAADLFSEQSHVAYEYEGLDYTNKSYFAHDAIAADTVGPCVACHMNGEEADHSFSVVEKDAAGVITGINADICVTCHDGEHALFVSPGLVGQTANIWNGSAAVPTVITQAMADAAALELEEQSEGYQNAGKLLLDYLNNANGLTNYTGAVIKQTNTLANDLGAYQNSKLPSEEPGGFAHNRYYVKRAIFDAIDWVDNGVMDGTITINAAAYPAADAWLASGAARP